MYDRSPQRESAKAVPGRLEPMTDERISIPVCRDFRLDQWDAIRRGLIPTDTDDKWFIYADGMWIHVHRSETGQWIYSARFEQHAERLALVEAWICPVPENSDFRNEVYARDFLYWLVEYFLLGDDEARFPQIPKINGDIK